MRSAFQPGRLSRRGVSLVPLILALLLTTSAAARPLDLTKLAPYFDRGMGAHGRAALQAGRYAEAVKAFAKQTASSTHNRRQARFLLAYALLKSADNRRSYRMFRQLIAAYPLLSDYARYYAAVAAYRSKRLSIALALTGKIDRDSATWLEGRLLRAEALDAMGRRQAAAIIWREYLEQHPKGERRFEATYHVALAVAEQAERAGESRRPALRRDALAKLKELVVAAPLSSWRGKAQAKLATLAAIVPGGKALAELSATDTFNQSLVYYRRQRNGAAEKGFARALQLGLPADLSCQACYYQAHSIYKQRQRSRAVPVYRRCLQLCRQSKTPSLVVKSLFNLGRGLRADRHYEEAIAQFARIEQEFPQHSYADDARLLIAEILATLEREDEVDQVLSSLAERYPHGDMAREAIWRLAFRAYLRGDLDQAQTQLDRDLGLGRATIYYAAGRALYWKARILERQRHFSQARKLYEDAAREYPLSYYALLALNRLRERHATHYRALLRELIAPVGHHAGTWTIPSSKQTRSPAFRRGVELARLGLPTWAGKELSAAGFSLSRSQDKDKLWWSAVLYDRAQLWNLSHAVPRYRDRSYRRSYPLGSNVRYWRLSYPRAFQPLVTRAARHAAIAPALAWAIMREESAFNPHVESYANAVGLMQLILPTARAAAAHHGMAVNRQSLQDPSVNIRLGTTYLGFLEHAFDQVAPLAIAGYNGGHGAVFRWLQSFRQNALDELIERIPYDQTRRYTKRVLSSLFAYQVLYERSSAHRVPKIGLRVPTINKLPAFSPPKRKKRRGRRRRAH